MAHIRTIFKGGGYMKANRIDDFNYNVTFKCNYLDYRVIADKSTKYNVSGDFILELALICFDSVISEESYNDSVKWLKDQLEMMVDSYYIEYD